MAGDTVTLLHSGGARPDGMQQRNTVPDFVRCSRVRATFMSDDKDPKAGAVLRIDGEAYDVTRWARHHPGGDLLLRFLGKDASAVFLAFHGKLAKRGLKGLRAKGEVPAAPPVPEADAAVETDFLALHARAETDGRFASRGSFFVGHAVVSVGLAVACAALLAVAPAWWPLGALMLGLAWQQGGWLSHDLLHHSVFDDRTKGDRAGAVLGGVLLGYSADWWKRKHNLHHALPNVLGEDSDIDVLPFLAFNEHDVRRAGPFARAMVRVQPVTAVPIVALARANWAAQGLLWALFAKGVPHRGREVAAIAAHYAWTAGLLALLPTWGTRLAFYGVAQAAAGLMIGSVFLVGHNARPMVARSEAPGFHALQVLTTQNIRAHWSYRWFFGGLERQIEHHLFPTMPRHRHAELAAEVRALCERHGLAYTERGFAQGLGDVFAVLARMSRVRASTA